VSIPRTSLEQWAVLAAIIDHGGFAQAEARMDRFEDRIEARFDKMEDRFDKVDARFEKVDARFEKMDDRFLRLNGRFEWMWRLMLATYATTLIGLFAAHF